MSKNEINMNNIPRLRFPGFTGGWEEKVLSDCLEERNEQFPEDEKYPLMAFVAGKGVSPKGERYDRSALVKDAMNKKYKRTEFGDFIYSSNNLESGSIGFNSYGPACISPVYSIFKSKNNIDPAFIGILLTQKSFISEMIKYRQGVVYGQWKIPEKEFLGMKVFIPSPLEQKKIASCLSELDNLIFAQDQKVKALKEKKAGLMQQLFPQPGETIPKLRFQGYTGDWEEIPLRKVATKVNRRNSQLEVTRVLTNSANAGVIDQSEYFDRDIVVKDNTDNYHIVELGDFVYNPRISATAPVGPISINKVGRGIMSPLYTVFKFHAGCVQFFEQYFQTTIWHPYLKSIANFGARFDRMNITSDGFFNMPLMLPTVPEQQKIAECLSAIDNNIADEAEKLESLRNHKKGLMQQLFPQPAK